jgi:hypothetical protein
MPRRVGVDGMATDGARSAYPRARDGHAGAVAVTGWDWILSPSHPIPRGTPWLRLLFPPGAAVPMVGGRAVLPFHGRTLLCLGPQWRCVPGARP